MTKILWILVGVVVVLAAFLGGMLFMNNRMITTLSEYYASQPEKASVQNATINAIPKAAVIPALVAQSSSLSVSSYVDSKFGFQFQYTTPFELLTSTTSLPVGCENGGVCVVYDLSKNYANKTIDSAAIVISLMPQDKTEQECDTDTAKTAPKKVIINKINFFKSEFGGAAMGHSNDIIMYNTFHNSNCYSIKFSINTSVYDPNINSPDEKFTDADSKSIQAEMMDVLKTFKFTK